MLQFLETGKALYVLAAVCALGIFSKWLTRNLYKRLIKETDNMTLTKNRNLRSFRQKTENTYRMNQGIPHVQPFLERQMYDFRFMRVSLNGWTNFSTQMTILCFLLGGAAAFGAYWYRCEPYYIVLYGSMGILAGLFTILVDNGMNLTDRKQQLFVALDNYLENVMLNRLERERISEETGLGEEMETARGKVRQTAGNAEPAVAVERSGNAVRKRANARAVKKEPAPEEPVKESGGHRDLDYLKHSLEQIAVSREKTKESKTEDNWLKDLDPGEVKLIGEIIKEYLS